MFTKILLVVFFTLFTATAALAAVNINTADVKELTSLPGIGWSKAAAIINYRTEHGDFTTPDDLVKVKGIGGKTLGKIRDKVTLGVEETIRPR